MPPPSDDRNEGLTLRRRNGDGGGVFYSGSTSTSTLSPTPALRIFHGA